MNLEQTLIEKCPNLFRERNGYNRPMALVFGGVPSGWYNLVLDLCISLEAILLELPEKERIKYYALQVKEKFGGLRFYTTFPCNSAAQQLIISAENLSLNTCEVCGITNSNVKTMGYSWIRTLCIEHRDEMLRKLLRESVQEAVKAYNEGREPSEIIIHKIDFASKHLQELELQRKSGKH